MSVKIYRPSTLDFDRWVNEYVWSNDNTRMKRYECISFFTEDVRKWIESYGYVLHNSFTMKAVAHWLYAVAITGKASDFLSPQRIRYPIPDHRDWQEDHDYFHFTVTQSEIDTFLLNWRFADDFLQDTRMGQKASLELANLLYTYVNLDASENGRKIAEWMEGNSSESDSEPAKRGSRKDPSDIYLQEMNEGNHGGGVWSKV
jgi:hypothetical protein